MWPRSGWTTRNLLEPETQLFPPRYGIYYIHIRSPKNCCEVPSLVRVYVIDVDASKWRVCRLKVVCTMVV